MYFDIKKFYILSASSLAALFLVLIISNFSRTNNRQDAIDNPIPTPIIVINKVVKKVTKYVTPAPNINSITSANTSNKPSQNNAPTQQVISPTAGPAPACTIAIDGAQYNVSAFRNIHSGGNIFRCGSDMSSDFWGRHGQKQLNQMQKYRI